MAAVCRLPVEGSVPAAEVLFPELQWLEPASAQVSQSSPGAQDWCSAAMPFVEPMIRP